MIALQMLVDPLASLLFLAALVLALRHLGLFPHLTLRMLLLAPATCPGKVECHRVLRTRRRIDPAGDCLPSFGHQRAWFHVSSNCCFLLSVCLVVFCCVLHSYVESDE